MASVFLPMPSRALSRELRLPFLVGLGRMNGAMSLQRKEGQPLDLFATISQFF